MKRLYNLMLACLLMVSLSACGKQAGADSSADKVPEQYGRTESAGTTEQTEKEQPAVSEAEQTEIRIENNMIGRQEQQLQGGDNTVTGDISFNFETKTVLLNSGYEMPIYGIGTYSLTGDICAESVKAALNSGVRLIDTAYMYHNEESVGEAVRNSGIPREEIFVITKLYPNQFSDAEAAIEEALVKLDIDYIDMMLIHHPGTDDVEAYLAMEKAVADGKIRSLGLSNWYVEELEEFIPQINIMPALVQNEIHPYYQENTELFDFELTEEEMERIGALDRGEKHDWY